MNVNGFEPLAEMREFGRIGAPRGTGARRALDSLGQLRGRYVDREGPLVGNQDGLLELLDAPGHRVDGGDDDQY